MSHVVARMVVAVVAPKDDATIQNLSDVWELLRSSILDLFEGFVRDLPIFLIAAMVFVVVYLLVKVALRGAERGLVQSKLDDSLRKLAVTFLRLMLLTMLTMVALSVAGVEVGAALAALGLLGLAFAFAFQNILENFIAGVLILMQKPFRIGDQIIASEYEGTVVDVTMRVTKLTSYAGVTLLLPNADVFKNPVVNLTEQGQRRTTVMIGIDYRDDHDAAGAIIRDAVMAVEGVLLDHPIDVLLTELGESSVDFEVRYWTAPDSGSVRRTQDAVLRAAKTAVEGAGMSIPWPIRTLEPGAALRITTDREGPA